MKRQTLSVVTITFNEEKFIGDCIKSLEGIADEIIVFDDSSTDNTRQLARKLKASVYKTSHEPYFDINKNKAIKKAKSDWILQIDADERLTPELRKEISRLLAGDYFGVDSWLSPIKKLIPFFPKPKPLTRPAAAYRLPRRNLFLGRYLKNTGQYPDPVIRLFQKGKAYIPNNAVHKQMEVDGSIGWLQKDLDHLASPSFERYLTRENRYSDLEATTMYKKGVRVTVPNTINYLFIKPLKTFLKLYIRYRGFLDGFPGFVFSLYSGFHHAFSYMKLWEIYKNKNGKN